MTKNLTKTGRSDKTMMRLWRILGLSVLVAGQVLAQNPPKTQTSPKAIHSIAGRGGVAVQGYEGMVREIASSPRHLSLSVVPKEIEESEVGLHVVGLDQGNYYLSVSGSDPRIVSATDMALGTQIHLPAVVGAKAEALNIAHQEWTRRIEAARALAVEFGLAPSDAPESVKEAMRRIEGVGEGLAETAGAREATIRVTPQDSGPVPLPFPKGISGEELVKREGILKASCRELIGHVASLERPELRQDLLDILVPIEVGKVSGSILQAAGKGGSGTGELSFDVSNPLANPPVNLGVSISAPEGWKALGNLESHRKLEPGHSQTIKATFELSGGASEGRVAIPLELNLDFDGINETRRTGVGFGHDFIRDWRVAGPFSNPKNRGADLTYPPEEGIDLDATYEGLGGRVGWKEVKATDRGYVDLKLEYAMNTNCLAYAAVWIYSPRSEPVLCASGSNDGIQVWMNDREVFRYGEERGAEPETDVFPARLSEGWNRLLVKSLQTGGNWGFYFEIRDRTGAAASDWKFSTLPPE